MDARGPAWLLPLLLFSPALSGCIAEDLHVALRVPMGEIYVIEGERVINGTLHVEPGGTLVLDGARLRVAQALVVEGKLEARASEVRFLGGYARQNVELSGESLLEDTRIHGARVFAASAGATTLRASDVQAGLLRVSGGAVTSENTTWHLGPAPPSDWDRHGEETLVVDAGALTLDGGGLSFAPSSHGLVLDATVRFANLSVDVRHVQQRAIVARGEWEARNVTFTTDAMQDFLRVESGKTRLVDAPLPRNARLPYVAGGVLQVGWTLTVQTVAPPGNVPVGGLNVTLTSASDPSRAAGEATTDEKGEARLVALQYAWGGASSRTGNPHVVRAEGGGKAGASPAFVVERPMTVVVPVAGRSANETHEPVVGQPAGLLRHALAV